MSGQLARATGTRIRRATHAEGAGETGLGKIIELHGVNAAGDALIAVSLAGTLFFSVPTGEARGQVALYLLVTMAPFVLVAPIIGPILDRFRHGRRGAIATTFAARAFLAWVMADAVAGGGLELFPAAFGVLVASKAYVLSRSACVPRLLPPQLSLVKANSRISLAGVAGVAIGTPLGAALATMGSQWSLRAAFCVFVVGTILAALLPRGIDATEGELEADVLTTGPIDLPRRAPTPTVAEPDRRLSADLASDRAQAWADRWAPGTSGTRPEPSWDSPEPFEDERAETRQGVQADDRTRADGSGPAQPAPPPPPRRRGSRLSSVGPSVVLGLRANAAIRAMTGFLMIFMLFLVRDQPLGGLSSELAVAVLGGAAVLGSLIGSLLGSRLRHAAPEPIIFAVLVLAAVTSTVAAVVYSVATVIALGMVAALAQQLGKLALDAQIQRDVDDRVRASAFARTETAVQLAWVLGGALGIVLPLNHTLGLAVLAVGLVVVAVLVGGKLLRLLRQARAERRPRTA